MAAFQQNPISMNAFEKAKAEIEEMARNSGRPKPRERTPEAKLLSEKYERNELLVEQTQVSQNQNEPFRKIFNSNNAQFTVWYSGEKLEEIVGIQVSYGLHVKDHVITKLPNGTLSYTRSDEGNWYSSGILRANGEFVSGQFNAFIKGVLHQLPKDVFEYLNAVMSQIKAGKYHRYPL